MFIREIIARFRNLEVSVAIDSQLLPYLDCADKISSQRTISINLYKLVYAIGTIQTRRFAPSNRMKFIDKSDLIEKIYSNTNELRIKVDSIRENGGSEVLKSISEDFGVGISVAIAETLFNIQFATIQRIYGNKKRPDWKCLTSNNLILVVESKGSSSQETSNAQVQNALTQKVLEQGDVRVVSLSVLKEHQISTNRFLDPPIDFDDMNLSIKNKILKAGHYSSVFSFLGHSVLSKYYSQMRKRLLNTITQDEQENKNRLYFELRDVYPNIEFENKTFTGTFYNVGQGKYIFIGIDKRLLSYNGFLEFYEYQEELDREQNRNHYILFKDGILIIEINNVHEFSEIVNIESIDSFQEDITISDVDAMTGVSFEKYIKYILEQNGFQIEFDYPIHGYRADIIGRRNNKQYLFELKLLRKKHMSQIEIEQLLALAQVQEIEKVIFITNSIIPEKRILNDNKLIFIGRDLLRSILKNKAVLLRIIEA